MSPPLKGKQPRRGISFNVTAEQYAILLAQQAASPTRIGITSLAQQAFERGLELPAAED